ncbi:DNA-primase RepB domain-containing protein [Bryobacter aggregatus]|uniref:DNA-primase RepB domain-containing protein n=1 Tax=Bryobacter aggregatus TaxID=360054 RepID=UPI00068B56E8
MKCPSLIAVERQIRAMGCELYEIGLYKPHLLESDSKEPEMLPRTWDQATLLRSVPWLRYQNAQGRNIYIRPKGEHHLSMVDDLTVEAIKRMNAGGFTPSLVVETSPGNFQAWLNNGQILERRLSTLAARTLAMRFGGDKGAADWRHFGRLAGFTNRKAKHQAKDGTFPFVRIIEAKPPHVYSNASAFLSDLHSQLANLEKPNHPSPRSNPNSPLFTIDDFRSNPKCEGDGNRIDLAYSVYALAHGLSQEAILEAISSRELSKKGPPVRQSAYTTRTIEKAMRRIRDASGRP